MPGERLSMRKIRDVLRLRHEKGLSQLAICVGKAQPFENLR